MPRRLSYHIMRGMTNQVSSYATKPQDFLLDLGGQLRKRRKREGLTIAEVAGRMQTTYNTVLRWESAVVAIPWDKAIRYCATLGCRLRDVLPRGA